MTEASVGPKREQLTFDFKSSQQEKFEVYTSPRLCVPAASTQSAGAFAWHPPPAPAAVESKLVPVVLGPKSSLMVSQQRQKKSTLNAKEKFRSVRTW